MECEKKFAEEIYANLDRVSKFVKDVECKKKLEGLLSDILEFDKKTNTNLSVIISDSVAWMAESTKDKKKVEEIIKRYYNEELRNTIQQYKGDVANDIMHNIAWVIEECQREEYLEKYIRWLNNGQISPLLKFIDELGSNEGLKIKEDIFSTLGVNVHALEKFNQYAKKIYSNGFGFQKKIELLSLLKEIVNQKEHDLLDMLLEKTFGNLKSYIQKKLDGLEIRNSIFSIKYGILLINARKKDANIDFLVRKNLEEGSIANWYEEDPFPKEVINEISEAGFDDDLLVASGKLVKQTRASGENLSVKWNTVLRNLTIKVVGNKKLRMPPRISIYGVGPKTIFKTIKNNYFDAINGDVDAGKKVIAQLREIVDKVYSSKKMPSNVRNFLSDINILEKSIIYNTTLSHHGAKVSAVVWKRRIPEDLYDSERIRCCIYHPYGTQKEEIPLFIMDPKTTMLHYYIQGIAEPVAASTLYIGHSNKRRTILLDTWDGGRLVYVGLGVDKMKDFVVDSLVKMAKLSNAEQLLVLATAEYGRAEEFCNYLGKKDFVKTEQEFEAVDVKDSVLQKYSCGKKHHYTDAFRWAPLEGKVPCYAIEI